MTILVRNLLHWVPSRVERKYSCQRWRREGSLGGPKKSCHSAGSYPCAIRYEGTNEEQGKEEEEHMEEQSKGQ